MPEAISPSCSKEIILDKLQPCLIVLGKNKPNGLQSIHPSLSYHLQNASLSTRPAMDSKRDYMDQGSYLIMSPRSKCLLLTWEILGRRIVPHPPCLWDFGLFQAASCFKRGGCSLGLGLPRVQAYNAKLLEERIGIKGVAVRTSSDWIADRLLKTTSELQAYTMLWEKKARFGMVFTQVRMMSRCGTSRVSSLLDDQGNYPVSFLMYQSRLHWS